MSTPQDLKTAGLKATLPRLKIINLFEQSSVRHLTAEDVYRQLLAEGLDVGLATVYRVLTQFEQAGLLVRHHFETGKAVFELNQGGHHDHLVCLQCGRVEEFFDAEIEKRQTKVARERGFEIHEHALYLYAECVKPACPYRKERRAVATRARGEGPRLRGSRVASRSCGRYAVSVDALQEADASAARAPLGSRVAIGVRPICGVEFSLDEWEAAQFSRLVPAEIGEAKAEQPQRREVRRRTRGDDPREPSDLPPQPGMQPERIVAGNEPQHDAQHDQRNRDAREKSRPPWPRRERCRRGASPRNSRVALKHAPSDVDSVRPAWPIWNMRMTASVCANRTVRNAILTGVFMFCLA